MTGTPFVEISRGTVANDGTGDTAYAGAGKINALIRAANAGQLSGFRNKLINGGFDIWQRGTSFTGYTEQYIADRWKARRISTTATVTFSRQTGFSGATYCLRVARDAGDTDTGPLIIGQQIETVDAKLLAGKTVRVSADVRCGATFSATSSNLTKRVYTGTGTDENVALNNSFTGVSNLTPETKTLSTTAARITWAAETIPATATEITLGFYYTPVGTAGASDYFEITNIQIEIVDATDQTPTPFEVRPFAVELAQCERYCQKSFALATTPAQNVGANTGEIIFPATAAGAATERSPRFRFRRQMRTTPTITLYNPAAANAQVRDETASGDCSSSAVAGATADGFQVTATGNASTAIGGALGFHYLATAEL